MSKKRTNITSTKVVVFDLCGVLIDVAWENMEDMLKKNNVKVPLDIFRKVSEEVFQLRKHKNIEDGVNVFLKKLKLQNNDLLRKTQISFLNNWGERAKPNAIGVSILKFAKISGLKTAVLSNVFPVKEDWKKKWNIDIVNKFFFSYETGVLKPDKQAFLNVSQCFNVEPKQCLMIGDSRKKEINPASKLGMKTIYWSDFLKT